MSNHSFAKEILSGYLKDREIKLQEDEEYLASHLKKIESLKQRIELQKDDIQAMNEAINKLSN